jgi:hypothetical protein
VRVHQPAGAFVAVPVDPFQGVLRHGPPHHGRIIDSKAKQTIQHTGIARQARIDYETPLLLSVRRRIREPVAIFRFWAADCLRVNGLCHPHQAGGRNAGRDHFTAFRALAAAGYLFYSIVSLVVSRGIGSIPRVSLGLAQPAAFLEFFMQFQRNQI